MPDPDSGHVPSRIVTRQRRRPLTGSHASTQARWVRWMPRPEGETSKTGRYSKPFMVIQPDGFRPRWLRAETAS
jgi:hypothetical protein